MALRLKLNSVALRQCLNSSSTVRGFSTVLEKSTPESGKTTVKKEYVPSKRDSIMKVKQPISHILDAIPKIKSLCWAKFDETIEISLNTGLDPRKPNQSVKGVAKLPFGTGKSVKVCVFAAGSDAAAALEAGADKVGSDDLIPLIQSGEFKFDTVIATPEMMSLIGKVGKVFFLS